MTVSSTLMLRLRHREVETEAQIMVASEFQPVKVGCIIHTLEHISAVPKEIHHGRKLGEEFCASYMVRQSLLSSGIPCLLVDSGLDWPGQGGTHTAGTGRAHLVQSFHPSHLHPLPVTRLELCPPAPM